MVRLEATSFACKTLSGGPFSTKPPCQRRFIPIRKVVVSARREAESRDHGASGGDGSGRTVDENMIVLKMRIREMMVSETSHDMLPWGWMEWEKKYYEHYKEDVCEAVGLLQLLLMNTRPSLATGIMVPVALSVPFSIFVVMFNAFRCF